MEYNSKYLIYLHDASYIVNQAVYLGVNSFKNTIKNKYIYTIFKKEPKVLLQNSYKLNSNKLWIVIITICD